MRGHGEKLSRRYELALAALLAEPTITAAAARAGLSEATLQRWLARPDFRAAYRAARRQVMESAMAKLQAAAGEAVDTLRRNLNHESGAVEVRAAVAILEHAGKAVELMDLAERVEALEARLEAGARLDTAA